MAATFSPEYLHPSASPPSSNHSSPPVDLRHMVSNPSLATPHKDSLREHRLSARHSQRLPSSSGRLGSRSPSSIPSSPTSVRSSSSAIFERDIEPIVPPSPPHLSNPHRIPRSKATEQLEQSVPSVLDSAAVILVAATPIEEEHIAVLSPARDAGYRSGVASPIGSLRSRSPSPTSRLSPGTHASLLLNIPSPSTTSPSITPLAAVQPPPPRPTIQTQSSHTPLASPRKDEHEYERSPSIKTPTSAYFSTVSTADSSESSPTTTTVEHPPALPLPSYTISPSSTSTYAGSPYTLSTSLSHPPSPTHASKRLSFMSYSDLLASTPASLAPLSSFTGGSSSIEEPPHIPSVSGFTQAQAHAHLQSHSTASSVHGMLHERDSMALLDDGGGEWEREGLGRGLEERLEALMTVPGKA